MILTFELGLDSVSVTGMPNVCVKGRLVQKLLSAPTPPPHTHTEPIARPEPLK